MKVEVSNPFKPITIILETAEDYDRLLDSLGKIKNKTEILSEILRELELALAALY